MNKLFSFAALALAVAATSVPFGVASAQDLQLKLGKHGPRVELGDDDHHDRRDERSGREECTTDHALDKAERMGLHRARIDRVGRRSIDVRGRRDGDRVTITFDRWDRRCGVLG